MPTPDPYAVCNGCNGEFQGVRYKCMRGCKYDICTLCKQKGVHSFHTMSTVVVPEQNSGSVICVQFQTFIQFPNFKPISYYEASELNSIKFIQIEFSSYQFHSISFHSILFYSIAFPLHSIQCNSNQSNSIQIISVLFIDGCMLVEPHVTCIHLPGKTKCHLHS